MTGIYKGGSYSNAVLQNGGINKLRRIAVKHKCKILMVMLEARVPVLHGAPNDDYTDAASGYRWHLRAPVRVPGSGVNSRMWSPS